MLYRYNNKELDLLGRIMRAEAIGEGQNGMLLVGNVVTNRILADCDVFTNLRTLDDVIYQQNAFASTDSPLFFERATEKEKQLARKAFNGFRQIPAYRALWFYAPRPGEECLPHWFNQRNSGRYKGHCFYEPDFGMCPAIH